MINSKESTKYLSTETVKGTTLSLKSEHNVHSSYSLTTSVLSVGNSITDDIFKEDLQHSSSFFIDGSRNTLDSSTTSETTNGRLGDTLDVITKNFSVALGSRLSKSFASFSSSVSRH